MKIISQREFAGGVALLLIAATVALSIQGLRIGTPAHMGPGFFPLILVGLLAVFGIALCVQGMLTAGPALQASLRQPVAVLAAVALFGLCVGRLGLVPAIVVLVAVSALGDRRVGLRNTLVLAAVMVVIAFLVFKVGLKSPVPLFAWAF